MQGIPRFKKVAVSSEGQIVLPKELCKNLFPEGSRVAVIAYEDHIEVHPLSYLEKMECALLSEPALAKEWNTPEEDKAWEHLL
jgi:bifunctional DNA-binding transcriptional regulator/antitoxin component of YhaV-PrlF toxin-antitoxin module